MQNKKVLIIIPAYNEQATVDRVYRKIKESVPDADVAIINDCSTDRTANVASELNGALINLPINLGIGGAMQTGYIYARNNDYDFAIQVDGDGQHDPKEITKILTEIEKGEVDLVIGSRFIEKTNYKSALTRRIGIGLFKLVTFLMNGQAVADATSGFRVVNKRVIDVYAEHYPTDYPEPEVLVMLHKAGFKIKEVPVQMHERAGGKSSITPVRSAYYMIKVLFAMIIKKMRKVEKTNANN